MLSIASTLPLLLVLGATSSTVEESVFPKGHLKPLGSHCEPEKGLIDDLDQLPSPREFWEQYVRPSKAVVLRGAAKHSPAFTKWTDQYMRESYGDLDVRVERKREKSGKIPVGAKGIGRDTIGNFIQHYHHSNSYIVSELPTPMWAEVDIQPFLTCGALGNRLVEVDLWMSGGGSSSILHKDAFNAINCVYNGTKEWKMIEYKHEDKIYKFWEPEREIGGFSRINPIKVDLLKYPKVAQVPWSLVTINAGDCLFLPKSYYHQVTSHGTMNVAIAILFSRFDGMDDIDLSGCQGNLSYTPLSAMDMDWKYPGHGNLSMGNPDLEEIRKMIIHGIKVGKPNEFLYQELNEIFPEKPQEWIQNWSKKIVKAVGLSDKTTITEKDIENLTRDEIRSISLAFEPTDLSNTELHEYTYVNPSEIRAITEWLLQQDGKLDKKKFIELYQKEAFGTEKFANEIIDKLSNSADINWISQKEVDSNLAQALEPYIGNQREEYVRPGQTQPESNDAYDTQRDDDEVTIDRTVETQGDRVEL